MNKRKFKRALAKSGQKRIKKVAKALGLKPRPYALYLDECAGCWFVIAPDLRRVVLPDTDPSMDIVQAHEAAERHLGLRK